MPTTGEPSPPPLPWLFFLVAIAAAVAVGATIAYLGLTGHLGAGIPGSKAPAGGLTLLPSLGTFWVGTRRAPARRSR